METSLEINGQYENKIFFVKNRSVKYLISLFFFFPKLVILWSVVEHLFKKVFEIV